MMTGKIWVGRLTEVVAGADGEGATRSMGRPTTLPGLLLPAIVVPDAL